MIMAMLNVLVLSSEERESTEVQTGEKLELFQESPEKTPGTFFIPPSPRMGDYKKCDARPEVPLTPFSSLDIRVGFNESQPVVPVFHSLHI
jgi:hypothetical protein